MDPLELVRRAEVLIDAIRLYAVAGRDPAELHLELRDRVIPRLAGALAGADREAVLAAARPEIRGLVEAFEASALADEPAATEVSVFCFQAHRHFRIGADEAAGGVRPFISSFLSTINMTVALFAFALANLDEYVAFVMREGGRDEEPKHE